MKQDTDRSRRDRQRRRRKQKQTQWLIALLAVVILAVAAVLIWQSTKPEATPAATPAATATPAPTAELEIDPNAGELVTPTPAPTEPGVAIPGWGSITLPAGVTEAATTLKNPEANEGWYYLTFEMRLPTVDEETGEESYEVLFTTGLDPAGAVLQPGDAHPRAGAGRVQRHSARAALPHERQDSNKQRRYRNGADCGIKERKETHEEVFALC